MFSKTKDSRKQKLVTESKNFIKNRQTIDAQSDDVPKETAKTEEIGLLTRASAKNPEKATTMQLK